MVNWVRADIWHQDAPVVLYHQHNMELVHGKLLTNGVSLLKKILTILLFSKEILVTIFPIFIDEKL